MNTILVSLKKQIKTSHNIDIPIESVYIAWRNIRNIEIPKYYLNLIYTNFIIILLKNQMATSSKKKCRQYSVDYLRKGFIPSPSNSQLTMCLICEHVFSNEAMKPSRLKEHFSIMHPHHSNKDIDYFEILKAKVMRQNSLPNMFKKGITKAKEGMVASYNISKLIAKDGKPHSIGETLILPAITEVISTVMNQNAAEIIRSIPLSNDIVARRIDEMAYSVDSDTPNYRI